ncbi:MAG: SPOR domain-containing protein [Flavobacteriales bacterium]|nr:SPOR domain-containing protein [Flavobacteriales bacterium]
MKRHLHIVIITIILALWTGTPSMAQSTESERLKSALEQAFAPSAATTPTTTPVSKTEDTTSPKNEVSQSAATPDTGRLYYVQLFYSRVPADAEQKKAASKLGKITRYTHNNLYKYCAGGFPSKADADAMVPKAKKAGYTSAFVIALKDGQRTDL